MRKVHIAMHGVTKSATGATVRLVACLVLLVTAATIWATDAHAQEVCATPLYLDPAAGVDVEACGTEEIPCGTLAYAAERAFTCSLVLEQEVTIMQFTGPDYRGAIAVGLADAAGLEGEPLAADIGAETEPAADQAAVEEAPAEPAPAEEAPAEAEPVAEEAAEEGGFPWTVSRASALYSVLALFIGIVIGVVMGYGTNSGDGSRRAAPVAALLLAMGAALAPAGAQAQTQCPGEYAFYVPETGQDVEMCGTAETPCQTFEYTLSQASACPHGVTIYEDEMPIFILELSSDLADVGDNTVSEIGGSAANIEVADETDRDEGVEEVAEEAAEVAVEVVATAEAIIVPEADEPVGDLDDWIWWIGWLAVGAVIGYAAHALPSAKLE